MAHACDDCDRTFVEEYLLQNHQFAVHTPADAAEEEDLAVVMQGSSKGSIFAMDTRQPDRKNVIEISGTAEGGFTSRRVTDYNTIARVQDEIKQVSDKLAGLKQVGRPDDIADSDDSPEAQAYLMQAWQALALYLANADDEDKPGAMQALKMISNLMSDETEGNQPLPTGAFGTVSQASLESQCHACDRAFSTDNGLRSHLAQIHSGAAKAARKVGK